MTKINKEEYELLRGLSSNWKWLASHDSGKSIVLSADRPVKSTYAWFSKEQIDLETELFQFVKWSDTDPYFIEDLIKDYKKNTKNENLLQLDAKNYREHRFYQEGFKQGELQAVNFYNMLENEKKVIIPNFIAEWIEKNRSRYGTSTLSIGYDLYANNIEDSPVKHWITSNQDLFIHAWLDGYTIEELEE